jgi:hypothetical protein
MQCPAESSATTGDMDAFWDRLRKHNLTAGLLSKGKKPCVVNMLCKKQTDFYAVKIVCFFFSTS